MASNGRCSQHPANGTPRERFSGYEFAATIGAALLLAALGTHLVASALEIQTTAATGHKRFGRQDGQAQALISGSSLTYDAVNWSEVAEALEPSSIESWPVPGSSPAEWEQLQQQ